MINRMKRIAFVAMWKLLFLHCNCLTILLQQYYKRIEATTYELMDNVYYSLHMTPATFAIIHHKYILQDNMPRIPVTTVRIELTLL